VEPTLLLIVGQAVTEAANDKQQLKPMTELIEQQSGQRPEAILADNGYCSEENLEHLESAEEAEHKIEGFIATGKQKHGEHRLPPKSCGARIQLTHLLQLRRSVGVKPNLFAGLQKCPDPIQVQCLSVFHAGDQSPARGIPPLGSSCTRQNRRHRRHRLTFILLTGIISSNTKERRTVMWTGADGDGDDGD
jgi:hypothetical protein